MGRSVMKNRMPRYGSSARFLWVGMGGVQLIYSDLGRNVASADPNSRIRHLAVA
jgi:hypothetical protein